MTHKSALLIVDMQKAVIQYAYLKNQVISHIRYLVEKARTEQVPVIWVRHSDQHLVYQSASWALSDDLIPLENESIIEKHYSSAYEETELNEILKKQGVTEIVLTGAQTNACIRATAFATLERGYHLTVVQDAHTTDDFDFRNGRILEAQDIILELSIAFMFLTYPGRKNRTVKTKDIQFNTEIEA
jgi:nicotinamidase-related amidase